MITRSTDSKAAHAIELALGAVIRGEERFTCCALTHLVQDGRITRNIYKYAHAMITESIDGLYTFDNFYKRNKGYGDDYLPSPEEVHEARVAHMTALVAELRAS